jgi:hypothetical protein
LEILFWHALVFRKSQPWSFLNGHKWKMLRKQPVRDTKGFFHAELPLSVLKTFGASDAEISNRQPAPWENG